jgi:hypothetical protein
MVIDDAITPPYTLAPPSPLNVKVPAALFPILILNVVADVVEEMTASRESVPG